MFAARIKLYLDWLRDDDRREGSSDSRKSLLVWYNKMGTSKNFDGCNINNIVILENRQRKSYTLDADALHPDIVYSL